MTEFIRQSVGSDSSHIVWLVEKIIGAALEPRWLQRELIAACSNAALRNAPHGGKHRLSVDDFRLKRLSSIGFV